MPHEKEITHQRYIYFLHVVCYNKLIGYVANDNGGTKKVVIEAKLMTKEMKQGC